MDCIALLWQAGLLQDPQDAFVSVQDRQGRVTSPPSSGQP